MQELENKKQLFNTNNEQEKVNKQLYYTSKRLKNIPSIGYNYMQYMSALIYAIYESTEIWKEQLEIRFEDIEYIIEHIDNKLYQIRQKEKAEKLFTNIKFKETIDAQDYKTFQEVITELNNMIIKLKDEKQEGKLKLAEAFEYIIMKAAQNNEISLNNTQYYTPKGLIKTIVKLLDIKDNMAIYNPACGTGNFITQSAKSRKIYVFGEETDINNYNICITNLWLHDIYNRRIKESRKEKFPLVDIALANPPFVDKSKEDVQTYYKYGIPLTTSSYTKYLIMMLDSIHQEGKIAIILPHGFLFKKTKIEQEIRRQLVEKKYIDAIIGLPEKLFYNTKIPVTILLINKARRKDEILFIDASKQYTSERKTNILTIENQDKIANTYKNYEAIPNYSYVADLQEVRNNNYDLNIKRYVKIENIIEDINQEQIERQINSLEEEKYNIQRRIKELLDKIGIIK